jgi:hypothetical protein
MPKPENIRKRPPVSTSIKKGQVLNPTGRPKKNESMTEILRSIGDIQDIKMKDDYVDRKTALAHKMWSLALSGDLAAMKYVYDRNEPIRIDLNVESKNETLVTIIDDIK